MYCSIVADKLLAALKFCKYVAYANMLTRVCCIRAMKSNTMSVKIQKRFVVIPVQLHLQFKNKITACFFPGRKVTAKSYYVSTIIKSIY